MGKKKLSKEEFIEKAKKAHGDKYDYSEVEYVNNYTKVNIKCPKHGMFLQIPNNHLNGKGCKKCGGSEKSNTEEFIERAKNIHGDKYNYSEVVYVNSYTKVKIICFKHGMFLQRLLSHLRGDGCPKCGKESRIEKRTSSTEDFIKKAKKVHGNKYDYAEVEYVNAHTKVNIICPKHGLFTQIPDSHLKGNGCKKCGLEIGVEKKIKWDKESCYKEAKKYEWVRDYRKKSASAYQISRKNGWLKDYVWLKKKIKEGDDLGHVIYRYLIVDKYVYIGLSNNIDNRKRYRNGGWGRNDAVYKKCKELGVPIPEPTIIERCKSSSETIEREIYWIKYYKEVDTRYEVLNRNRGGSLGGLGCTSRRQSKEQFIIKAKNIHGDKYDYSEVVYVNNYTKVNIICLKHGVFLQRPANHLSGNGCPECGGTKKKWNKVSCYKEAKKYKWLSDYIKNSASAYVASLRNGWLKDYDWLKKKI